MATFEELYAQAPASATQTIHPRQWMTPGYYWAFLRPEEAGAMWTAFTKQNPSIKTKKTVGTGSGTAGEKGAWVLFEVTGSNPVIWTLPGLPSKALKGAATEYSDVVDTGEPIPDATDSLADTLKNIGDQLGLAGKVLLWGGVGILLYKLLLSGGGAPNSRRSAPRESEPEWEETTTHRKGRGRALAR